MSLSAQTFCPFGAIGRFLSLNLLLGAFGRISGVRRRGIPWPTWPYFLGSIRRTVVGGLEGPFFSIGTAGFGKVEGPIFSRERAVVKGSEVS